MNSTGSFTNRLEKGKEGLWGTEHKADEFLHSESNKNERSWSYYSRLVGHN